MSKYKKKILKYVGEVNEQIMKLMDISEEKVKDCATLKGTGYDLNVINGAEYLKQCASMLIGTQKGERVMNANYGTKIVVKAKNTKIPKEEREKNIKKEIIEILESDYDICEYIKKHNNVNVEINDDKKTCYVKYSFDVIENGKIKNVNNNYTFKLEQYDNIPLIE